MTHSHRAILSGCRSQLRIERIKFQSSVACWGYFSIGAKGGIHEYADSQFGHIFAHGNNREEARKALMLSLKNIEVVGEIRNPVEHLGRELVPSEDVRRMRILLPQRVPSVESQVSYDFTRKGSSA